MGVNNPLEIRPFSSYDLLVDYWLHNGRRPSAAEATAALKDWLEAVKIGRNVYHRDVTDAMFRQVGSAAAVPFERHVVRSGAVVRAVEYDLGRSGSAYHDNDSARYQYASPSSPSVGNRGWRYRNDGVDIEGSDSGYHVFGIEDGEWLQYTVDVAEPGTYTVSFAMAGGDSCSFSLLCDGRPVATRVPVGGEVKGVRLRKGECRLRVVADKGGFTFSRMEFRRDRR